MKKKSPKNKEKEEKELEDILKNIELIKTNDLLVTYFGNKGYTIYKVSLNEKILNFIKKELTVKPFIQNSLIEAKEFPIYQESEKKIYVPRFWGIKYFGIPKSIKISYGSPLNLKFNGQLRDYQENIINSYLKSINLKQQNCALSSALIELKCGGGKTIIALKLIEILKKKTIIFVQKTFLKNQWIERINEFLPNARIGTIQGQIIDIEDKDIVIAMVQSISMKSYPDSIFDIFGFSIYDEVHHMSSMIFSNCLKKCNTYYALGLSATMNRKDGLTCVFKMYLGEICFKSKEDKEENNVLVKAIEYNIEDDDDYNEVDKDYRGNVKYSTMISKISNYQFRNDFIINVLENELNLNDKQQIILLAHNKSMLFYLSKILNNKPGLTVGFYIGGMKEQDLKQSENKKIILATYSMAAEALDIKTLTTLVLSTPKSDIIQAVGRILRQKHTQPLIVDIVDSHSPFQNQFTKRKSFYNEKNYKIIKTNNSNYINYIKEIKKQKSEEKLNIELLNNLYWKELKKVNKNKTKNTTTTSIQTNINISEDECEGERKCLINI